MHTIIHTTQLYIPDLERQFCLFERPMTLNWMKMIQRLQVTELETEISFYCNNSFQRLTNFCFPFSLNNFVTADAFWIFWTFLLNLDVLTLL